MNTRRLSFTNKQGHKLYAKLDLPIDRKPIVTAIFAHCFTCNSNFKAVRNISIALTQQGIGVLRFDFTGLGQSEGEFSETNFSSNVEDLLGAARCLEETIQAPQILVGHSLGGAAVLIAGLQINSVKAVATIGAPAEPIHVKHLIKEGEEEIKNNGHATVNIGGRPFKIKRQFLEDLEKVGRNQIGLLEKALLVLHSPQDEIVGIENAEIIYKAAVHPKSYISLDGADHMLTNEQDALYAGQVIASWAIRYLEVKKERTLTTEKQVITSTGSNGYLTDIQIGPHHLLADEPESVGGSNLGPTPYGYLSASLGSCTGMTLRMYADRKKWELEDVIVHISHSKEHARDCEDCEGPQSKIDVFDREIEIIGNLDEQQIRRLMEIADKCPVHRTLHGKVEVRTSLLEPGKMEG